MAIFVSLSLRVRSEAHAVSRVFSRLIYIFVRPPSLLPPLHFPRMDGSSGAYHSQRTSITSDSHYAGYALFFMRQVALVTHSRRSSLEAVFDSTSRRAQQYEVQMKDLEAKLAEDLSNSRAIETYLREVVQGLEVRATPVRRSSPHPAHRRPPYPYLRSAAHHTPFQVCAVNYSTANQA